MTKPAARVLLLVCSLAFAAAFAVPAVCAAEKTTSGKKTDAQKKQDEENLRKYDKNRNGKLDPDEAAELKADQEKARRKKRG